MDELRSDDPQWIGAYRLLGRLGTGGMGRVYLARSDRGRTVAVKLVRAELAAQEEFRTRFRREVQAARRVGGRWTAPVLDADTEAAIPWVATGYVAGPSLQHVVAHEYGPLPERSVRVLAAGLAHALADIHTAGLVHRDLKPSNVMITIDGPRVIDFGIARALETVADGSLTHTGAMVGSPAFMSPEQVRGDRVTPACDVFCLGSVLAYAATGLQPFGAASSGVHAQMFRIVQEPPDLDAVPEGLRGLVAACLVKEPALRPSPAQVLEWLGAEAADVPGGGGGGRNRDAEPWLPGGIVAQLGRHAVGLLELEAVPERVPDHPVPEAVGEAVSEAVTVVPVPPQPVPVPEAVTVVPAAPRPVLETAPEPEPAPEPPTGRARRGALVAVLALLAVIAGGTTAFVVVREGQHGDGHAASPPSPTRTHPATSTAPAAVPPGMVGTWRTAFGTELGDNTRELTVRPDGTVELDGTSKTYSCVWSMKVTAVGPPTVLSPSQVTSGEPAGSCNPGEASSLTLVDDTHLRRANVDGDKAPLTYEKVG